MGSQISGNRFQLSKKGDTWKFKHKPRVILSSSSYRPNFTVHAASESGEIGKK